jgi:hypothetical protein
MRKLQALWSVLIIGLMPAVLVAAPADGSTPLLCAVITVTECMPTGECQRETAESVNIPQFIRVDVAQKTLHAADDTNRTTAIKSREHLDGRLILQGGEGGRGWSMVIAEATGKMSATVVEDEVGFVIFGACTVP